MAILIVLFVLVVTIYISFQQNRIAREIAIDDLDGIEVLEEITLGGVPQTIYIRGKDIDNPVLLFLHGGPGVSELVPVRHYNRVLEEHFVVVSWDQRGTGKSYSKDIDPDTLNLDNIVEDTLELTETLLERFETEKIFLVGHSWGSIVGVHAVDQRPDNYYGYVGIGQGVNFVEAEVISYQYTLEQAHYRENKTAIRELKDIGPPPYSEDDFEERLGIQRKWLFKFGGEVHNETDNFRYLLDILRLHLLAPEYSVIDIVNLVRGNNLARELMWDELLNTNLPEQVPELKVPVYFFTGRYDYVTVYEKVEEYYDLLQAPKKELIWFENSAHSPNFEEPDVFIEKMIQIKNDILDQ